MNLQLPLAIQLHHQAHLKDFLWGENQLLHQQLENTLFNQGEHLYYLWGEKGCGKTHLLQGACQAVEGLKSATYIPLKLLKDWGPDCIEGLEEQDLIALDDIDAISTDKKWEEALFHLYNKVRDKGQSILLIAGNQPPTSLALQLADLKSRLSWSLVVHLKELNDELKVNALQLQAQKRGFELNDSVARFLVTRCVRNMHYLQELLDKLDNASLAAQRKITLPFVKAILGI